MTCQICRINRDLFKGKPSLCEDCQKRDSARIDPEMRSYGVSVLRPRIVLYNESHPEE